VGSEEQRVWPDLQWGDVLVVEAGEVYSQSLTEINLEEQTVRSTKKISVAIGDQIHSLNLGLSKNTNYWSATSEILPDWRLSELAARLVAANPLLKLDQIKLRRTIEGKVREWTIDLQADRGRVKQVLANLVDRDQLIFTQVPANDAGALQRRKNTVVRLAPGRLLGEIADTREKDLESPPQMLFELITDAYSKGPMLIPNPDFAHVVIHRLKNDSGEQEDIPVSFSELARSPLQQGTSGAAEAKAHDIKLMWGDAVEIPALRVLDERSWTQLGQETVNLLANALRRDASVKLPEKGDYPVNWTPRFLAFSWEGEIPSLNFNVNVEPRLHIQLDLHAPAETITDALHAAHVDLERLSRIDVNSGDKTQQISIEELRKTNPKFQDGDLIVPVLR
jgi:hypothetical protein